MDREEGELKALTDYFATPKTGTDQPRKKHRSRWGPELEQPLFSEPMAKPTNALPFDRRDHRPTMLSNFRHESPDKQRQNRPLFSIDMLEPSPDISKNESIGESAQVLEKEIDELDNSIKTIEQELKQLEQQEASMSSDVPSLLQAVSLYPLHHMDTSRSKGLIQSIYSENQDKLKSTRFDPYPSIATAIPPFQPNTMIRKTIQSNKISRSKLKAVYVSEYRRLYDRWQASIPPDDPMIIDSDSSLSGTPIPVVRSDEAFNQILANLIQTERNDPSTRWMLTLAKPSPMEDTDLFLDYNALDPFPVDTMATISSMQHPKPKQLNRFGSYTLNLKSRPFTKTESNIFMEKYLSYPKQWDIIAKALPGRTSCEIIQYYYENKKRLEFKKWLRMPGQKKKASIMQGSSYVMGGSLVSSSSSMSLMRTGQSRTAGSRMVMSETMLDILLTEDEARTFASQPKKPGRPRKQSPSDTPKKTKNIKAKNEQSIPVSPIIPTLAMEHKLQNKPPYVGFPWMDWRSKSLVFWLPLERTFLVDAYIQYGPDWKRISQEFSTFRSQREGIHNWRDKPANNQTLVCMLKAHSAEDPSIPKLEFPIDSEEGVKLFFTLYHSSYRIDSICPKICIRTSSIPTEPDSTLAGPGSAITAEGPDSSNPNQVAETLLDQRELDAWTVLENLADMAHRFIE